MCHQNIIQDKQKIILTSHKYIEKNDSAFDDIVGLVKNIDNGIAESVEIIFTYYDTNGDIVGTDNTYVNIQKVKSRPESPISQLMDRNTTIGMTNYEIALKWNNADGSEEYLENVQLEDENNFFINFGGNKQTLTEEETKKLGLFGR